MSIPADGKTDAVVVEDDAAADEEAVPEKEKPARK